MDSKLTDGFVTVHQFAEELDVAATRVQSWIRDGVLPVVRLGRLVFIPRDALRRILEREDDRE